MQETREELSTLDAKCSAQIVIAGLIYPFLRSRPFYLWGRIGYDRKALKDEALGLVARDKRVGDWALTVQGDSYDRVWGGGLTNFLLGVTRGKLDLSHVATDAQADGQTARTQGRFTRFNYSLARLQKMTERVSLFVAWNGQHANKNLDSV